jgi:flagellar basal-body rod modification protein FlgD
MNVGEISHAYAASASAAAGTKAPGLGGSDFMLLLLAELRNQNPMDPVKDRDFMAQITQVNSFLELQKLNANLTAATKSNQLTQAASLIGKTVTYAGQYGPESGLVSAVRQGGESVMLVLGNREITLDEVTGVTAGPAVSEVAA